MDPALVPDKYKFLLEIDFDQLKLSNLEKQLYTGFTQFLPLSLWDAAQTQRLTNTSLVPDSMLTIPVA
jgi:hypothetical protein